MMLIEIHEMFNQDPDFPSGYASRLIYYGNDDSGYAFCQIYMDSDCAASASSTVVPPTVDDMMTEMEMATHNLIVAPGGMVLVISSMALGSVFTWYLMRFRMRKYHAYKRENVLGDLSMRAFEEDDHYYHSRQQPGIDSAILTGYGAIIGVEKKLDEDALI